MTQLEAAKAQLDRALTLFLNDRDFIPAATLAGAAEGIMGSMLQARDAARRAAGAADDSLGANAYQETRAVYAWLSGEPVDEVGKAMRAPRNALNHATASKTFDFHPPTVAEDMIERAMSDYHRLTGDFHERYCDFRDAVDERRHPD
jgi:hypothetical protein